MPKPNRYSDNTNIITINTMTVQEIMIVIKQKNIDNSRQPRVMECFDF